MTRTEKLPRIALTWSLMLLTVIAGVARPSCLCADGSWYLYCPKVMAALVAAAPRESTAATGCCSPKSCCHGQVVASGHTQSCAAVGSPCTGSGCRAIPSAIPATVREVESLASQLGGDVAPAMVAKVGLSSSRESLRWRVDTHRAGPPRELIVLYQRWLI